MVNASRKEPRSTNTNNVRHEWNTRSWSNQKAPHPNVKRETEHQKGDMFADPDATRRVSITRVGSTHSESLGLLDWTDKERTL